MRPRLTAMAPIAAMLCGALLVILPVAGAGAAARSESVHSGEIHQAGEDFVAEFPAGGTLTVHVRSGDVDIVGTSENQILVRYSGVDSFDGRPGEVSLSRRGQHGELDIKGFPRNHGHLLVQVPQRLALRVRMPAGDLAIAGITGDKDVELHAGDLVVQVGERGQYAHVDASVLAGDLSARPFGVQKDGLFRSFEIEGAGAYHLHAHVGAGDLIFRN
jgi:hypothetical protein